MSHPDIKEVERARNFLANMIEQTERNPDAKALVAELMNVIFVVDLLTKFCYSVTPKDLQKAAAQRVIVVNHEVDTTTMRHLRTVEQRSDSMAAILQSLTKLLVQQLITSNDALWLYTDHDPITRTLRIKQELRFEAVDTKSGALDLRRFCQELQKLTNS